MRSGAVAAFHSCRTSRSRTTTNGCRRWTGPHRSLVFLDPGRRLQVPSTRGQGRLGSVQTLISGCRAPAPLPAGLRPYGGSSYWCLSGEAVSFVHRYVSDHPEFVSFFRRVFIPDELFFQTLLVNSELRNRIVNDNLRYMRWTTTGSGPEVLRVDDFDQLRDTDKLFARKFDQGADGLVLQLIEEHLL
jgi:Core-2/I-Branching enzyme